MINYNQLLVCKCDESNVNDILNLQNIVIKNLIDKSVLRINNREMFVECTKCPNLTIGIYDQNTMIGLCIFVDAKDTNEDLSIGLENFKVEKSANFKLVFIHPDYRGFHLMLYLMEFIEIYAIKNSYSHLCVTVSPDNKYSLNNILAAGYKVDHQALKYGGCLRNVCVKQLDSSILKTNHLHLFQLSNTLSQELF